MLLQNWTQPGSIRNACLWSRMSSLQIVFITLYIYWVNERCGVVEQMMANKMEIMIICGRCFLSVPQASHKSGACTISHNEAHPRAHSTQHEVVQRSSAWMPDGKKLISYRENIIMICYCICVHIISNCWEASGYLYLFKKYGLQT